jgi:poly [ADP-ribose] polymerase
MANVLKTVKLICANIDANNNKFWDAELFDDGTVTVKYGRVGYAGTTESRSGGQAFLDSKVREKKKKGYVEFEGITVPQNGQSNIVIAGKEAVKEVAKKQIQYSSPKLEQLIERLARANVHNITQNTKIQFDVKTGLFSTPRGIITPPMISGARDLLAEIKSLQQVDKALKLDKPSDLLKQKVQEYLMVVPKAMGMSKYTVDSVFPDQYAFDKEMNILDSLEASYASFTSTVKEAKDTGIVIEEKMFNVKLDVLTDKKEYDKLVEWYQSTKKKVHGYDNVNIVNVYAVDIGDMSVNFDTKGAKLGSVEQVFHGTSEANLLSILKSGLRVSPPSTAYIAGKMFGNGVYGAKESSKALGYTLGRWGNQRADSGWLFICDFAMGKTYNPRNTGHPPHGYDSTWARARDCGLMHDELIVYKNEQIKVKYLLECK